MTLATQAMPLISHAHVVMPCDTMPLVQALIRRLGGELIPDDGEYITVTPMPERERVGRMLRGLRIRATMTQKQLAKAIDVPQGHISEYEANKRPIPAHKVALLAKILNTVEGHFIPR